MLVWVTLFYIAGRVSMDAPDAVRPASDREDTDGNRIGVIGIVIDDAAQSGKWSTADLTVRRHHTGQDGARQRWKSVGGHIVWRVLPMRSVH